MKKTLNHLLTILLVLCMIVSVTIPALAASWDEAIVDTDAAASITLHKYDWTNAIKDGVWDTSYVSTGVGDANVETTLGQLPRTGDPDSEKDHALGNGSASNGYAVAGVEFSYLRVADIATLTETITDSESGSEYSKTTVLYGFDKTETAELLAAIGLTDGNKAYSGATSAAELDQNCYWYEADVLNQTLAAALTSNATGTKDALENYMNGVLADVANGEQVGNHADANNRYDGGRMAYTDADGFASATNLEVGLYILVETKVPEMVTVTTNPFFVSLPMTRVSDSEGGHAWNYNVELYPKNETGIVTLSKEVREAQSDTGKNGATDSITDGFSHNATASTNDIVEYQIISTLPTISSQATALSTYRFNDSIAAGLTYTSRDDVVIQWYTDADCTNLIDTWEYSEGYFDVTTDNDTHTREIAINASGLAVINGIASSTENVNNGMDGLLNDQYTRYAGYSNYTLRITYRARLNHDSSFIYGDAGNNNTVVLTWKRTSSEYYDTLLDDCHVYSYGLDLTKTFSDKTQAEAAQADMFKEVKFKIRNVTENNGVYDEGYYVIAEKNEAEGVWYVTGHSENEGDATIFYPLKATNYDGEVGHIVVKGLEDDTYELTEVETADGYTLLSGRVTVSISVSETSDYCDCYVNEVKQGVYQNDGHYNYDGCPDLPLANIPQQGMAHHLLTANAEVGTKSVAMLNDTNTKTGKDLVIGTDADVGDIYSENALVPLTVANKRGWNLPQTGEESARYLPLIGASVVGIVIIAATAGFLVLTGKRRKENGGEVQ